VVSEKLRHKNPAVSTRIVGIAIKKKTCLRKADMLSSLGGEEDQIAIGERD